MTNYLSYEIAILLPTELWQKIFNMKRKMEHDDRWGWGDVINDSKEKTLLDPDRWWVGRNRWSYCARWPDLDRATHIYIKMYLDEELKNMCNYPILEDNWHSHNYLTWNESFEDDRNHYELRFALLDEISPSRLGHPELPENWDE